MEELRLSISLTSEALKIYRALPKHEKSSWVSQAIIEKHQRESGNDTTSIVKAAIEEHIKLYHKGEI